MKIIKHLTIALMVILLLVALTACGGNPAPTPTPAPNPVKEDLKDYINNYAVAIFGPLNEEIVNNYTAAVQTNDGDVLVTALKENLSSNAMLIEEMEAYTPATAEVQELHNIFLDAVKTREIAYADILVVLTDLDATEEEIRAAFDMLAEADSLFAEFSTELAAMRADLGL